MAVRGRAGLLAAVGLAALGLLLPVLTNAFQVWVDNDDLRFGLLLLPTAAWLGWQSRSAPDQPATAERRGLALAVLVASVCGYLLCERLALRTPAALAAGCLLWAGAWYLWGWHRAARLVLPIGLLTYALALQPTLVAPLGFALQGLTAASAERVGQAVGLGIVREGLILRGDSFAFVIAEACSGMNSLLALVGVAGVWVALVHASTLRRAAVVASVLPLTIVANTVRIVLVLVVAAALGEDMATGFFHGASSLVLFGVACVGLVLFSRVVGCRMPGAA